MEQKPLFINHNRQKDFLKYNKIKKTQKLITPFTFANIVD